MTPKQARFVDEYLLDMNATQAAIRAGYSKKTAYEIGYENMKKPEIAIAVAERKLERAERTQTSTDWVIQSLVKAYETAKEKGNLGQAIRALELIGKHHGAFLDRVEQTSSLTVEIVKAKRAEEYSDDELASIMAARMN